MEGFTPQEKKKMLAAAKIVAHGDAAVIAQILEFQDIIEEKEAEVSKFSDEVKKEIAEFKQIISEALEKIGSSEKGDKGNDGESIVGPVGPRGPKGDKPIVGIDFSQPKNGKDGESIKGEKGEDGKDGSPDTPEQIVEKINSIPLDDEDNKIGIEHIEGWEKGLNKLINLHSQSNTNNGGGIIGRDIVQDIDLSSQLNGVTKTFNIPATWRIISVDLSSFPYGSCRKGTDYTYTPQTITFTSEIDAATQLASGQTCILTVVTA